MSAETDRRERFERWAETYDSDVAGTAEFPFAGYEQVLDLLLARADPAPGASVLDLGTGTGNLAGRFLARGCSVWGTDAASEMLAQAAAKFPGGRYGVADLEAELPPGFPERYDRVVAGYSLHHLELGAKARLIERFVREHLRPGGSLLVADVAWPTARERAAARAALGARWDASEHYWAADETEDALRHLAAGVSYTQVSSCAGVFVVSATAGNEDHETST